MPQGIYVSKKNTHVIMVSDHSDPLAKIGGEETGGQNIYVRELSDQLLERGYNVSVFTRRSDARSSCEERSRRGFRVVRIKAGPVAFIPKEDIFHYRKEFLDGILQHISRDKRRDLVIHSHYWISGILALELREKLGLPLVHTFHSLGAVKHAALGVKGQTALNREKQERYVTQRADRIIATSPEERKMLRRYYQADTKRIAVIPVGVNTARFKRSSSARQEALRKKLPLSKKDLVVLYVGRLAAQKGLPVLLKAFALLCQESTRISAKNVKLLIIGGTPPGEVVPEKERKEQEKIDRLVKNLDLGKQIIVAGRVQNKHLAHYYSIADVCVVPSVYEPFGIVPLEAMACGTPVVCTRVGGMKYTVQNLKTGFHARVRDVADFAYKIRIILENQSLRQDFGEQAMLRIEEEFAWERVVDSIIKEYRYLQEQK